MASNLELQRVILHEIVYSDVFDYPLTARQMHCYLTGVKASLEEVSDFLYHAECSEESHAVEEDRWTRVDDYFMLCGRGEIVETRKCREEMASHLWDKTARYGRIVASLPFVCMVAVTGSLAMNNTEEGKDIDYLIVTAPGRLWACRALSLLITRIARLEGISLCPSYLVSENALELTGHSLYAAHELTQMIPISGTEFYEEMRRLNQWTNEYLPNAQAAPKSFVASKCAV